MRAGKPYLSTWTCGYSFRPALTFMLLAAVVFSRVTPNAYLEVSTEAKMNDKTRTCGMKKE